MTPQEINKMVLGKILRPRQIDKERIKTIVESAKRNAKAALKYPLDDENATLIFRELYESIRQLGDALWWSNGYEPLNHEISLELLRELNIKYKIKLNYLERFKKIRHDANYRGYIVSVSQTKEIIDFWKMCSEEIIGIVSNKIS